MVYFLNVGLSFLRPSLTQMLIVRRSLNICSFLQTDPCWTHKVQSSHSLAPGEMLFLQMHLPGNSPRRELGIVYELISQEVICAIRV